MRRTLTDRKLSAAKVANSYETFRRVSFNQYKPVSRQNTCSTRHLRTETKHAQMCQDDPEQLPEVAEATAKRTEHGKHRVKHLNNTNIENSRRSV